MEAKELADIVICMDADLQHDINAIDDFLDKRAEGYELLYGLKKSRGKEPFIRKITAQLFYKVMGMLGSPVLKGHADYSLMTKQVLQALSEYGESNMMFRALLRHTGFRQAPVYFDYGCNTYFGKFSGTNFNFTCLDVCPVHIGDNVMIGPNVTLATPMHPLLPEERNVRQREDGSYYNLEYAKPITIENDCWLASNVVVCGGVTIGEGSVIGAGSVVTRSIPPHSLAAGNPCRVIRQLTEADRMKHI